MIYLAQKLKKKDKKKILRTLKHETLPYPRPSDIDASDVIKMEPKNETRSERG